MPRFGQPLAKLPLLFEQRIEPGLGVPEHFVAALARCLLGVFDDAIGLDPGGGNDVIGFGWRRRDVGKFTNLLRDPAKKFADLVYVVPASAHAERLAVDLLRGEMHDCSFDPLDIPVYQILNPIF